MDKTGQLDGMTTLNVNCAQHEVEITLDTPLIFVLRNDLGLVSPKLGCGSEQCGACAVLVDGGVRYSCTTTVRDVIGCRIETLESFAIDGQLDAIQSAFLAENAGQCGYCLAGILVRVKALLRDKESPGLDEVKQALKAHLCRCGAHPRILRAIERVIHV